MSLSGMVKTDCVCHQEGFATRKRTMIRVVFTLFGQALVHQPAVVLLARWLPFPGRQDNTLTAPYEDTAHPLVEEGLRRCMDVFEGRVCIMSNSAGTRCVSTVAAACLCGIWRTRPLGLSHNNICKHQIWIIFPPFNVFDLFGEVCKQEG